MKSHKLLACVALGLGLSLSSCIVAAIGVGAAAGVLVHEAYVAEDSYEGVFKAGLDQVYDASAAVLDDLTLEMVQNRAGRTIKADVKGSEITVTVRSDEEGKGNAVVRVTARKHYLADRETAIVIFRKINKRLTGNP